MKRTQQKWFSIGTIVLFLLFLWGGSYPLAASSNTNEAKLRAELERIKQEQARAKVMTQQLTQKLSQNKSTQKKLNQEIQYLDMKMNETEQSMKRLQSDIDETEKKAQQAAADLDAAEARVEERNRLLRERVKALYVHGKTSYLEVVLTSKDFTDFLSRLDMMGKIVAHDQDLLEKNKQDQALIAAKKQEIDQYLADLKQKYAELERKKQEFASMHKERRVQIASLQSQAVDYEKEIEKYDEQLSQLVKEYNRINQELAKVYWTGGVLAWPLPTQYTTISSPFGPRVHPITKKQSFHSGIDLPAPDGTTIYAAESGKVILAEYYGGYGNTVIIDHGAGMSTLYGHIRPGGIKVKAGQVVERGQKIAEVGTTGLSTGNHLHFSVLKNGDYVNPMNYLGKK
ncbi:MAG: peptidoglycan DD-metalloendopeptidase family protein [Candidatus Carbobacillus altaicus]|uniref:Peptidase, M23/M37 family n=1 Tax=Candidatus Carbonibacillus altaicus TaxID=2163959 RepID=A0A2R6Y093_9BACL|nr:peptidoglycan DD-metalloendopeptidase family protein [Candidatus Carbobacillus altaicus]PTQ56087.1 MAG: peptidase, M23/M37 family [Candidatus Carbobacillus altaicus]